MAIVVNKARPEEGVDMSYTSYNRVNAGEPNGTIVPVAAGEIVLDTTNNCLWKAMGVANDTWVALTPPN